MRWLLVVRGVIGSLLPYLGLPLLGWGLRDSAGFFASPPRQAYGWTMVAFGLAVGVQAASRGLEGLRGGRGREDRFVRRQAIVRVVATVWLLGALLLLPYADRRGIGTTTDRPAARWLGVILFAIGLGLVYVSGLALGWMYSAEVTIQEGHRLLTNGLYRYIRHPRYLGNVFFVAGLALTFRSWVGWLPGVAYIVVLLWRIGDEEALMLREFGSEWEAYCQRSWRLIPYVY